MVWVLLGLVLVEAAALVFMALRQRRIRTEYEAASSQLTLDDLYACMPRGTFTVYEQGKGYVTYIRDARGFDISPKGIEPSVGRTRMESLQLAYDRYAKVDES